MTKRVKWRAAQQASKRSICEFWTHGKKVAPTVIHLLRSLRSLASVTQRRSCNSETLARSGNYWAKNTRVANLYERTISISSFRVVRQVSQKELSNEGLLDCWSCKKRSLGNTGDSVATWGGITRKISIPRKGKSTSICKLRKSLATVQLRKVALWWLK